MLFDTLSEYHTHTVTSNWLCFIWCLQHQTNKWPDLITITSTTKEHHLAPPSSPDPLDSTLVSVWSKTVPFCFISFGSSFRVPPKIKLLSNYITRLSDAGWVVSNHLKGRTQHVGWQGNSPDGYNIQKPSHSLRHSTKRDNVAPQLDYVYQQFIILMAIWLSSSCCWERRLVPLIGLNPLILIQNGRGKWNRPHPPPPGPQSPVAACDGAHWFDKCHANSLHQ